MQGKRHDIPGNEVHLLEPGEYGLGDDGRWWVRAPAPDTLKYLTGDLSKHQVVEHEDGTITVSPSILISHWSGLTWHGYLEHGEWHEA